jgi:hypothetical protein
MRRLREISFVVVLAIASVGRASAGDTSTLRPVWSFARAQSATAFDTRRQRMIVIGGHDVQSQALLEVLDLAGAPEWQRPATTGSPPNNVESASAVYDSLRDQVLLFAPGYSIYWSLSLAAPMTWSVITPTGSPVFLPGMMVAYDPVREQVIGHGGTFNNGVYDSSVNDTWVLTLGAAPAWSVLPTAGGSPPARSDGVGVWDVEGDRLLAFGGVTIDGPVSATDRSDVWQLTFAGGIPTWNPVATTGGPVGARHGANAAFDRLNRRLVVNGGLGGGIILSDTWSLELAGGAQWEPGPPAGPAARFAAATAYDPIAQRVVVAGGSGSFAAFPERGDTWELPLSPTLGVWTELLAVGGAPSAGFAGFDPAAHRFAAAQGAVPWYLSTNDSSWHPAGSHPADLPSFLGPCFDPGTNTFYVATRTDLYSLVPGATGVWTQTAILGIPPPSMAPGTTYFDRKRGRILLIGGWVSGSRGFTSSGFWTLSLGPSPSWSKIADATVLGARVTPPIEDVRRDRLLFFGGGGADVFGPFTPLGDLQELDLATLTFRTPQAAGAPPSPRYFFVAAYDSTRDRAIVCAGFSGSTAETGVYYLQFGPAEPDGAWVRNDPVGDIPSGIVQGLAAVDVERDVLYIADLTRIYEIKWGQGQPGFRISSPAPAVWTPGSILPLAFTGTQSVTSPHSYAWSVHSQRAWPGFPLRGFQDFAGAESIPISVGIPVPDSAAPGTDTLRFVIHDILNSGLADSCTVAIGDVTSQVLWKFVDLVVDTAEARLSWLLNDLSQTRARIDRRTKASDWLQVGDVGVSDGVVQFRDPDIEPGGRFAYRAGILAGNSYMWSDSTWVDIPAGPPPLHLAFASGGAIVVRGPLAVTFALPANDLARLDVLDLNGRQVAVGSVSGAGVHTQTLAAAGQLRAGIYFVRLRQNGAEVRLRAVVLARR